MTETIESLRYGKPLTLGRQAYRGGQGLVFETDDPGLLVKQFEPAFIADNLQHQEALQRQAQFLAKVLPALAQPSAEAARAVNRASRSRRG